MLVSVHSNCLTQLQDCHDLLLMLWLAFLCFFKGFSSNLKNVFQRVFLVIDVQLFEEIFILASTTLLSSHNILDELGKRFKWGKWESSKLGRFCIYYISFNFHKFQRCLLLQSDLLSAVNWSFKLVYLKKMDGKYCWIRLSHLTYMSETYSTSLPFLYIHTIFT